MNTSVAANKHAHWTGCMHSMLLASLNDGASIKGAVESLPRSEGIECDRFLSLEIARLAPGLERDKFIARLSPLVAKHERMIADEVVAGLNLSIGAAGGERITCTVDTIGLARRPMSNTLTFRVITDKHSRDPDQLWCAVTIDLDRPTGRLALQYGPRLPMGILKVNSARAVSHSASGYEELTLRVGECIQKALSVFASNEQPASCPTGPANHDMTVPHAIAV
jgi:hypothetical protein